MQRSDAEWAVPAIAFVLVQFAIGLIVSSSIDYAPDPPILKYINTGIVFGLLTGIGSLLWHILRMFRRGEKSPISRLASDVTRNRHVIMFAGLGFLLVPLQLVALTWLKSMLPLVVPFWADPYLASFDRAIFGTDPWRLLRPLPSALDWAVDGIYLMWFPIKSLSLLFVLALPPSRLKSRAMLAYFLMVGLFGVIGQYAFSSAGPIFYHLVGFGDGFRTLPMTAFVAETRDYLWSVYQARHSAFGGGISAMPSIHVAAAAWLALTVRSIWKPLAALGWAFYAIIFFGSVYLGWHYFSDGVVGTLAALASWKLSTLIIDGWRPQFALQAKPPAVA